MKLSKAFQYRNLWLGTATLLVVLFHTGLSITSPALSYIKQLGYCGVDIFLFASGIGCYYSLDKNPDILPFLKRRAMRLYPTYLCFMIPWLIYQRHAIRIPIKAALGNLLGLQIFSLTEYQFNWYISALLVVYLLSPYFKQIADSSNTCIHDFLMLAFLTVCTIPFWGHSDYIIFVTRIPVFYLGMIYGKYAQRNASLTPKILLTHLIVMLTGIHILFYFFSHYPDKLWTHGFCWYPFLLITPCFCIILSYLGAFFEKQIWSRWINVTLNTVGRCSFEVYLVHIFLYDSIMPHIFERFPTFSRNILWLSTFPVILIGVFLLNRITKLLLSRLTRITFKSTT